MRGVKHSGNRAKAKGISLGVFLSLLHFFLSLFSPTRSFLSSFSRAINDVGSISLCTEKFEIVLLKNAMLVDLHAVLVSLTFA